MTYNPHQDALQHRLGGPRPATTEPRNSTMPVPNGRGPMSVPQLPGIPTPEPLQPQTPPRGNSRDDFMSHAGRFAPNPSGLTGLMGDQQFRSRFPNARIHKNDWIDLGDGSGLIDSIRSFNKDAGTGEAWQWLTEAEALKNGAAGKKQGGMAPLMAGQSDLMAQILASLGDMQEPVDPQALLLQQLAR